MKRVLLLFGAMFLACSVWATGELPTIIIHKSNGGPWAFLNLYNDILYTPAQDEEHPATLDCTGSGYSSCRVPRNNALSLCSQGAIGNPNLSPMFADVINQIIEISEREASNGCTRGSQSKKIAIQAGRGTETYAVKGSWQYDSRGGCTMYIYVTPLSLRIP
ncbi:MAG: hypothetical protein IKQ75_00530 [Bacteroidales bacterium]|nr:hypothetical protein [Bacteroidales bacterium]MBR6160333.1 hypothetical protein [Bacteroidales bacterium]